MTADILDQQAVQIDGCGGARIEPALDPRRPPLSAPVRAPTPAPEFDQIGIFLRETRPIPGLLRRDRIHAHLHLLDLAPHLPFRPVKYDFEAVRALLQRHVDKPVGTVAIGARERSEERRVGKDGVSTFSYRWAA